METPFKVLAELCEKLESTAKRLVMIDLVADFLKSVNPIEIEPAVSMILGRGFAKSSPQTLDVSWATLSGLIQRMTGVDWSVFMDVFSKTGDIGSATKAVFERRRVKKQVTLSERSLTILELRRSLEAIAGTSGYGSREKKERLIEVLLGLASPLEIKYLVKILTGEMRTGFHEGLMDLAVAKAFDAPPETVRKATMTLGDIAEVARIARTQGVAGLSKASFQVFKPVSPMLAQMADSVSDALNLHGRETAFEYKYDGARVQIHKSGDEVRVFSRRLTDVTESLPEIVNMVKENIAAKEAILEGEAIAVDGEGHPIPFQHLMRRFRRIHRIEDTAEMIPLRLYLFDVLYLDGVSLISLPYTKRREILSESSRKLPLTKQIVTNKETEAKRFLEEALNAGHEGLMAKRIDSQYAPGIRGKHWLKIKPVLEPLDLVIVAAEYGYGRRHDWLSDYYLGARDAETGEFLTVGKTFKGLTDVEMIEMTKRLKELVVKKEPRRVIVIPKMVVEVAYNEVQRSPTYKSGMALRFARITRVREDKGPEEADNIQRVREIYERQFLKKGRYKG